MEKRKMTKLEKQIALENQGRREIIVFLIILLSGVIVAFVGGCIQNNIIMLLILMFSVQLTAIIAGGFALLYLLKNI